MARNKPNLSILKNFCQCGKNFFRIDLLFFLHGFTFLGTDIFITVLSQQLYRKNQQTFRLKSYAEFAHFPSRYDEKHIF